MGFELSKIEIVKEIVKSGKDPVYFINTYCRISHPQKGLIKFDTFPYQDDLLQDFNDFRFTVILKPDSQASQRLLPPTLSGLSCFIVIKT